MKRAGASQRSLLTWTSLRTGRGHRDIGVLFVMFVLFVLFVLLLVEGRPVRRCSSRQEEKEKKGWISELDRVAPFQLPEILSPHSIRGTGRGRTGG